MDRFQEACRLRVEEGMSYKRIAATLGASVATVYDWTSGLPLSEAALASRARRTEPEAVAARAAAWSERCRERRRAYQQEGRARAREGDLLHGAGCMLYWAEGWKNKNTFEFANGDVEMVRLMRRFLVDCLAVDPQRLVVSLNVYTGNGVSLEAIENHWLTALELPPSCLRKHVVDHFPTSSSGLRPNRLPWGVCRLRLGDTRVVQHIYGAIQEYGGFEEPRWLD